MALIQILSGNALSRNPRVLKEAASLASAGYEVEVLGGWGGEERMEEDVALATSAGFSFVPVVRPDFSARLRSRVAKAALQVLGVERPAALGYGVERLLRAARGRQADLYIAHSEPALWAAARLAREGRRVGVDMEDWFSEDLPVEGRRGRPLRLLRSLEAELLRNALHRTCPSRAMSQALAARHGCEAPEVVYNAFAWKDREAIDGLRRDRTSPGIPSMHWYSQTIGAGRGLEVLFEAVPLLSQPAELHLRGTITTEFKAHVMGAVPEAWRRRIFFHPPVANRDLLSRIAEHDIGLALENRLPASRDLTVTNKILHYLLAGLPVVATDTAGQMEIAERAPGAIQLSRNGDRASLAASIDTLLASEERRGLGRTAALQAARSEFSWERQEAVLLGSVKRALAPSAAHG